MIKCAICGLERRDLSKHIKIHRISVGDYKSKYRSPVVDPEVDIKRRQTCLRRYGDENYRNEEAKKLSNEIYEGGHSLSDPTIRQKAEETKIRLYGDAHFTNRYKARMTCLERYGTDNVSSVKSIVEKRKKTLLARYGKIFNYTVDPTFTKEQLVEMYVIQGKSLREIARKYDMTPEGVSYWMKKYEIPVTRKVVISKTKEFVPAIATVEDYFHQCMNARRVLSFSEYGSITEDKKGQRIKRLFNAGRPYHYLLDELRSVALDESKWSQFLEKIRAHV